MIGPILPGCMAGVLTLSTVAWIWEMDHRNMLEHVGAQYADICFHSMCQLVTKVAMQKAEVAQVASTRSQSRG